MTGSAKIAWFIAAVLFSSAMPGGQAHGAAPKDALKYLRFNHTSKFSLREFDGTPAGYTDAYTGRWVLDWKPPAIQFAPKGSLGYKLHYTQVYTDNLNRIAETSLDSRQDFYKVNLNLKGVKHLTLTYGYDRSDSFQNNFTKNSKTTQTTSLGFSAKKFPVLSYGNTNTIRVTGKGSIVSSATESSQTWYQAQFRRDAGNFGQEYKYRYQVNTGTAGAEKSGASQFSGFRQFKFDGFGNLQFDYNFSETNKYKSLGFTRELYQNNTYVMSYRNTIPAYPLSYNFRFASTNSSQPNSDSNTETKSINLTYQAPAPEGKQLSVVFDRSLRDDFQESNTSRHTSEELTTIQWLFRTNPRTNGGLRYSQRQNTDVVAGESTSKNESMGGNLVYKIPGKQGEIGARFGHISDTSRNGRTSKDTMEFSNHFKLGNRANMNLFYSQFYDGSSAPRADTTISGFHYRMSSGEGISLDARWWQNMSRPREFVKRSVQSLAVNLRYQPSKFLSYDFLVNSNGTADTTNVNHDSQTYQSKNEIEFKVTYTF